MKVLDAAEFIGGFGLVAVVIGIANFLVGLLLAAPFLAFAWLILAAPGLICALIVLRFRRTGFTSGALVAAVFLAAVGGLCGATVFSG